MSDQCHYYAPDHQDVLPWLDEAVLDWEVNKTYRPDSHYILLFKGAANTIRKLRAELAEKKAL